MNAGFEAESHCIRGEILLELNPPLPSRNRRKPEVSSCAPRCLAIEGFLRAESGCSISSSRGQR
jgi:hypothetical protein